jgi:protein-disulfide isomerase
VSEGRLTPPVNEDDHIAGSAEAPVTLVEYGDYECPYCGMAYPIVKAAQRALGRTLCFVFRNFPLAESHPHARHAAEAAEAAAAQGKFWEMHDMLYEHQAALEEADLVKYAGAVGIDRIRFVRELAAQTHLKRVRDDFRSGVRSGVNGTPTFFINGVRWDGAWADPSALVDALRAAASIREESHTHRGTDLEKARDPSAVSAYRFR